MRIEEIFNQKEISAFKEFLKRTTLKGSEVGVFNILIQKLDIINSYLLDYKNNQDSFSNNEEDNINKLIKNLPNNKEK